MAKSRIGANEGRELGQPLPLAWDAQQAERAHGPRLAIGQRRG